MDLYKLNDIVTTALQDHFSWTADTDAQETALNDAVHEINDILTKVSKA